MPSKKTIVHGAGKTSRLGRSPATPVQRKPSEEYNCCLCDAPDSAGDMVQCDTCDAWSHYNCAGVDSRVRETTYMCDMCTGKSSGSSFPSVSGRGFANDVEIANLANLARSEHNVNVEPSTASLAISINSLSVAATNPVTSVPGFLCAPAFSTLKQPVLATKPAADTPAVLYPPRVSAIADPTSTVVKSTGSPDKLFAPTLVNHQQQEAGSIANSESSKASRSLARLELQRLEEERALQEKRDKDYLNKKYQLLSQIGESDDEEGAEGVAASTARVDGWAAKSTLWNCRESTRKPNAGESPRQQLPAKSLMPSATNYAQPSDHPQSEQRPQATQYPRYFRMDTRTPPTLETSTACGRQSTLTSEQLAARQVVTRELQNFDGKPGDWPLFISSFNRSTELCGFSDEENLFRLQRALKGEAHNAVRNLLIQPGCVHQVIETLRMLYGNPELIINSLIEVIRSTPPPRMDKLGTIVAFAIAVQNLCGHIEATGMVEHLNNPMLVQELVARLPSALCLNWAFHKQTLPTCSLSDFSRWAYQVAAAANGVLPNTTSIENKRAQPKGVRSQGYLHTHHQASIVETARIERKCCICSNNCVSVPTCRKFLELSRTDRWNEVRRHQLCRRCLRQHASKPCTSTEVCGASSCNLGHHRLLHNPQRDNRGILSKAGIVSVHSQMKADVPKGGVDSILFRVVPVFLYGRGVRVRTYALLDDGSSLTLIDQSLASQLNVKGTPRPLCLKWTGNTSRYEKHSEVVHLEVASTVPNAVKYALTDVHTVANLCLPYQSLDPAELQRKHEHLKGLQIEPYSNVAPRLLIGLNNAKLGLPLKYREGDSREPVATKTRLGWIIHGLSSGGSGQQLKDGHGHNFHVCECNNLDLHRMIEDYICGENFGSQNKGKELLSCDDQRALRLLNSQTIRKDGRFETTLLWKFDRISLPDSYPMAIRRWACLQKRMLQEPELAEALRQKIEAYILKGYARELLPEEASTGRGRSWYLPIFPVENQNKPGKFRIVWDAAAAVQGVSLNSVLLKGPDQLTPLLSVIYKFRQHRVAICGDIMEMFHQICIRKQDQDYQRFLWGYDGENRPRTYVMMVMTFGATCSPCTAQFIKNRNADQFSEELPRAVRSIKENHYVDDLMDSVPTESEAIRLAREIRHIHQHGGFHIRNWVSNSPSVLQALKAEPSDKFDLNLNSELETTKVLGMWWCTSSDCFMYRITTSSEQRDILAGNRRPTKREVLKVLMTIFDPLGLLAHFLMYIKILLQEVWRSSIGWDAEIQEAEYAKWRKWVQYLPEVENVRIPRCYITKAWGDEIQLHTFVDASENGFAAVAYVRTSINGTIETSLVGAKTRVAPLKALSIPRLELQAALLGARFAKCVIESHSIRFTRRFFWSDSKTVLSWLRSDHRRYRQFVAFRVSETLDLTKISEWRWVPTKGNVADEATKWQRMPDFSTNSRWFLGPKFLQTSPDEWPEEAEVGESTREELRAQYVNLHTLGNEGVFRSSAVSRWTRLLRSSAYVLRFIRNTRTCVKAHREKGPLTQTELQLAEDALYREAQCSEYKEEIAELKANRQVEKNSPIFNVCPFLDSKGILRASGRLRYATGVSEDAKQPIILPRSHSITHLIIADAHCKYKHQNHETVVNELRQMYYISRLRVQLKYIRRLCQLCKNNRARPQPPIMAQLPAARLASFCRPFSFTGIDYFGPISVTVGRRSEKRWGVLFTCLTTRAIHIEVAHSLTTDSCILCIRNFMARRGAPIEFHSDNGTNFHGAETELKKSVQAIENKRLREVFVTTTTNWKFIPPGAPHMGGCWERLVRSIKSTLYAMTPTRNPSDELLRSMLIEAEGIVNSRPLTYIPLDEENQEAITPNHFLLGSSSGFKPAAVLDDRAIALKRNWLASQQFADRFWRRWVAEYLPTLTRRTKWAIPVKPIEVGDIALIADPDNPRNCWPKGRITQVRRSKDGQVRSAWVQTSTGIYHRPVIKLAILDVGKTDVSSKGRSTEGECCA